MALEKILKRLGAAFLSSWMFLTPFPAKSADNGQPLSGSGLLWGNADQPLDCLITDLSNINLELLPAGHYQQPIKIKDEERCKNIDVSLETDLEGIVLEKKSDLVYLISGRPLSYERRSCLFNPSLFFTSIKAHEGFEESANKYSLKIVAEDEEGKKDVLEWTIAFDPLKFDSLQNNPRWYVAADVSVSSWAERKMPSKQYQAASSVKPRVRFSLFPLIYFNVSGLVGVNDSELEDLALYVGGGLRIISDQIRSGFHLEGGFLALDSGRVRGHPYILKEGKWFDLQKKGKGFYLALYGEEIGNGSSLPVIDNLQGGARLAITEGTIKGKSHPLPAEEEKNGHLSLSLFLETYFDSLRGSYGAFGLAIQGEMLGFTEGQTKNYSFYPLWQIRGGPKYLISVSDNSRLEFFPFAKIDFFPYPYPYESKAFTGGLEARLLLF